MTEPVGATSYSEHVAVTQEVYDRLSNMDVPALTKLMLSRELCFNCKTERRRVVVADEIIPTTGLTGPTGITGLRIESQCPSCRDRHVCVVTHAQIEEHGFALLIVARQQMETEHD